MGTFYLYVWFLPSSIYQMASFHVQSSFIIITYAARILPCIVILYCSLSHCQKFIIATFYSFSVGYFIVLSSDCFTMMSYWYCVSIVYACHLKLAFVHLLYLYHLCEHSITPCGLNKVYLILSYLHTSAGYLLL